MDDLLAARSQMAISLGFHILFAIAGMAMPVLMALAQWRHLATGDVAWRDLARRWAKGTAILFAVGAVSGTVLSFELGLLWPEFMRHAGPIIGMPFSLEGVAFFLEAIFLGLFLYGEGRISPRAHLLCGIAVAVSGTASAVFVTAVNAWMNEPVGFAVVDGVVTDIDPWATLRSPAFATQAAHVVLGAYAAVAFVAMGIHAVALRRVPDDRMHRHAFALALGMALVTTPLQILSGDLSAKHIAEHQPLKLAAAEGLFTTTRGAPIALGGWPDAESRTMKGAIEVPVVLSVLATGDPDGEVIGLDSAPPDLWPPLGVVHLAFDIMVGCGSAMLAFVLWAGVVWVRSRAPGRAPPWARPRLLLAAILASPLGVIAIEAGWTVTEVGRQPWVVTGFLRTADAVTPMPNVVFTLVGFTALFAVLGVVVVMLLRNLVRSSLPRGRR